MYRFESARDLFEAAREAAIDAEKCRRMLEAMERKALRVASPSFEARVSGGDHDRISRDVAALVDRETDLQARIDADYDLIDAACTVLYGRDGMSDGLSAIGPAWWADAVYQRYLAARPWPEVGYLMGYNVSHVRRCVNAAFELMDANGMVGTIDGHGSAED